MARLFRRQTEDEWWTAFQARGYRQSPLERWLRRIKRVLLAALVVAVIAFIVAALHTPPARPAPAPPTTTTTTTAGTAYIPAPAGPPVTDPNGQWISEPDPSAGGGR